MARPEQIRLGDLLISQGLLTEKQLQSALEEQRRSGRKLGRVIAESGFASEEAIAKTLAQQLKATYVDLRTFTPRPELTNLLPEKAARRHRAIVLDEKDGQLMVGFADPTDQLAFEEIGRIVQREISLAVVQESDLMWLMNRAYLRREEVPGADSSAAESGNDSSAEENAAAEEMFDVFVSLPTPVEKEILARRLAENIGIEAEKLDALVRYLNDRRVVKIRSEVPRALADKLGDDCRQAGLETDIRESLRLVELVEKVEEKATLLCPACGMVIAAKDNLQCPNCNLVITKGEEQSEYFLKRKIEEEERARIELKNEQRKKSNEQFLKEEQERKLREEVRAQLDLKKENDLRIKQANEENALQKRKKINRTIHLSSALAVTLALTFAAGRWFASKPVAPPAASQTANAPVGPAVASQPVPPPVEVKPVNQAGKVELVEGDVFLFDIDKKQRTVKPGDSLNEGDTIVTGKNGELHLKMRDDGFIAVRPNTDMQIVTYRAQGDDQDKGILSLAKGSFRSVTGWIGKFNAAAYQVKTPTATIGVRGTDHEPLVIPADSTDGEPGTYDKVNVGASYIETQQGKVDVPAGRAGFSPVLTKAEKMAPPRLLPEIPQVFKPTHNEKTIDPRHDAIQKIVEKDRDDRHKQVDQVCRKE